MADPYSGPSPVIRVVVVDDDPMARRAIVASIARADDIIVVRDYGDGAAVAAAALDDRPDVVLMDILMPQLGGVAATKRLLATVPNCRVLALTTLTDPQTAAQMMAAGAIGLLYKEVDPQAIRQAIRAAHSGLLVSSSPVPTSVSETQSGAPLNELQSGILSMVCKGLSNAQIADRTNLGETTVKVHLRKLSAQLGATNRASLVHRAYELGLV